MTQNPPKTSMTQPGPSPTHVHHDRRPRRRRFLFPCLICCLIVFAVAITAVILAVTLFKPKDPTTTLLSANVTGISPRINLPVMAIEINVTIAIALNVHNPNYASFSHKPGKAQLYYRGTQVGEADVAEGRIPSRGSEVVKARLTVEGSKVTSELGNLASDAFSGEIGFDTKTRLNGKVTFLGFIRKKAVALSDCHVVIGVSDLKVTSQECNDRTKL